MIELKAGQTVTHEEIAHYAYLLWEEDGKPSGRDVDYWVRAEQILYESREKGQNTGQALTPDTATSKASTAPTKKRAARKSTPKSASKTSASAKPSTRAKKTVSTAKTASAKKTKKAAVKKTTTKRATKKSSD